MDGVIGAMTYAILSTAAFYLLSRATVTRWLWSRYPPKLAAFFDCAACSGAWYGAALAAVFRFPAFSMPGDVWYLPVMVGLMSMVWTPMVAALMHAGFERLGDATPLVEVSDGD